MLKKLTLKLSILGIISWGLFCGFVYLFPQYIFYHPNSEKAVLSNAIENDFSAQEVLYRASDDQMLYGWYIKPKSINKVIVFYHGNSHNIEAFYHKLIPFVEAGYGVLIGEYRGFGGIDGKISQENIEKDAVAAVEYLHSVGFRNQDLILYGMSLGSYSAVYTAATKGKENPFKAVVLEVPFDSLLNVVKQRIWHVFPFEKLITDVYNNVSLITEVNSPVLIMGGTRDKVVPLDRAKALFERANDPKKLIVYSGAEHSNLFNYRNWRDILNWLNK